MRHRRQGLGTCAILAASLLLSACGGSAPASSSAAPSKPAASAVASAAGTNFTPALQKLIAQAKTEGQVVLYTASAQYTSQQEAQVTAAVDKYFGVSVQVKLAGGAGTPAYMAKRRAEAKAGIKPAVDLINVTASFLPAGDPLRMDVDWKALGISPDNMIQGLNSPIMETLVRGVIYNTKSVSAADVPHRLQDLLDPKWKGKIVTQAMPSTLTYMALVLGNDAALNLIQHLVDDQKMSLAASQSDMRQRVSDGEFPIGYGDTAAEEKAKGAPVENAPVKVGADVNGVSVLAGTAHPAAAQMLAYYLVQTPDGSKLAQGLFQWSNHTHPGTESYLMDHNAGLVIATPDWVKTQYPTLVTQITKLLKL